MSHTVNDNQKEMTVRDAYDYIIRLRKERLGVSCMKNAAAQGRCVSPLQDYSAGPQNSDHGPAWENDSSCEPVWPLWMLAHGLFLTASPSSSGRNLLDSWRVRNDSSGNGVSLPIVLEHLLTGAGISWSINFNAMSLVNSSIPELIINNSFHLWLVPQVKEVSRIFHNL